MLESMTITDVPAVRRRNAALIAAESGVPVLDVVVPVFNEQAVLADSIHRLHRHLCEDFPFSFRITIADNASTDDTPRIARALAGELNRMGLQMMLVPLGCPYDAAARVLKGRDLENSLPESALAEARSDPAVAVAAPLLIALLSVPVFVAMVWVMRHRIAALDTRR